MSDDEIVRGVTAEIEAFHDFLSAWFRGDVPRDDAAFDANLSSHWPAGMVNIQPAGGAFPGEEILEKIRDGYGTNPDFTISIHAVRLIDVVESGTTSRVVATYVERQRGARQSTPPENDRRSSVWMEREAGDAVWLWRHLHETAIR
ncbi:MAG: hypothetical protein AAGC67_09675 [Myxococcota bacterium]